MPENYDSGSGIWKWTKENAYVINKNPQFSLGERTKLYVEQGAYIEFLLDSNIKMENASNNLPHFSFIADGSLINVIKLKNYNYSESFNSISINTPGNILCLRYCNIEKCNTISLLGSNAFISDSNIGLSDKSLVINFDNYDSSKILNSTLMTKYPGAVICKNGSSNSFLNSRFYFSCNSGDGSIDDSIIKSLSGAFLNMSNCTFNNSSTNPVVDLSKIRVESAASIKNNNFTLSSGTPATPVNKDALNQIVIDGNSNNPAYAEIKYNKFDWCRNAIYIKGFETSSVVLDDLISNNTFTNCNTILKTDVPATGEDFPESPSNAAVDKDNNIYFTDTTKNRVYKYTPNGRLLMTFGSPGTGDGQFNSPVGIAVNDTGEIYVVDSGNKRIQKFDAAGNFILKFGQ